MMGFAPVWRPASCRTASAKSAKANSWADSETNRLTGMNASRNRRANLVCVLGAYAACTFRRHCTSPEQGVKPPQSGARGLRTRPVGSRKVSLA